MRIAPLADVKTHFSRFIDECDAGPVVVTRNGRPAAMLVPIADGDDIERLVLAHSPRFRRLLEEADRRVAERGVGHEAFWRSLERKPRKRRR